MDVDDCSQDSLFPDHDSFVDYVNEEDYLFPEHDSFTEHFNEQYDFTFDLAASLVMEMVNNAIELVSIKKVLFNV